MPSLVPTETQTSLTRRQTIQKAHEANLARLKPEQDARRLASKTFVPVGHTDSKGRPTDSPRANAEVRRPDTLVLTGVTKDGQHQFASIHTPEGQKAAEAQNKARRKMIEERIAKNKGA